MKKQCKFSKMKLVKIISDEDGTKIDNPKWCVVNPFGDSERALCTGQTFGYGEGNADYQIKEGKTTCPQCIKMLKYFAQYEK